MKPTVLLLIATMMLSGCISTHTGKDIDAIKLSQIKKGETTKAQLISMFGKPEMTGDSTLRGNTLTWLHSEGSAGFGGATSSNKTLIVWLDQSDVVTNFDFSTGHFDSNTK